MNIMCVEPDIFTAPRRYYIDCPIDTWDDKQGTAVTECKRIEIPRELALYMRNLQDKNNKLESRCKEAKAIYQKMAAMWPMQAAAKMHDVLGGQHAD